MSADALAIFNPEVMGSAMKMADQLAKSSLIPKALQSKPGDVLVVLLTGREFGLGPMLSMRGIHVVEGKPVMAADLMVGLCLGNRAVCEYFTLAESTPKRAVYKTKRVGSPEVALSWTIEQATAAGVAHKDNWKKYPDAMLRARCASALARAVYPDLLAGTYDPDEMDVPAPSMREVPSTPIANTRPVIERASQALPASTATREASSGTLRRAEPESSELQREAVEAKAADVVAFENPATPAPVVVAFGPYKGKALKDLSDDAVVETLAHGREKLESDPTAKWAKAVSESCVVLEVDLERRITATKATAQREPGED